MSEFPKHLNVKIAIVGAGPAGATLSLFLSKYKIQHLIIDKAKFPRDKICGDGFTPEVLRVLKEIDPKLYEEFISADWTKRTDGVYCESRRWAKFKFTYGRTPRNESISFCAKREDFDNWLVHQLKSDYATVLLETAVCSIAKKTNGYELALKSDKGALTVDCQLLVGADGERSIVRKNLHPKGIAKDRKHYAAAIRQYYKGVTPIGGHSPLEVYFIAKPFSGYLWIFHLPNNECNVGIGGVSEEIAQHQINLKHELGIFIKKHPTLCKRFENAKELETPKGWGLPLNSDAYQNYGENFILLGDAGKHIEPLTGKGIGTSMYIASLASKLIEVANQKNDFSAGMLKKYEFLVENHLRKEWNNYYYFQTKIRAWWFPVLSTILNLPPIRKYYEKNYSNYWAAKLDQDFEEFHQKIKDEIKKMV